MIVSESAPNLETRLASDPAGTYSNKMQIASREVSMYDPRYYAR